MRAFCYRNDSGVFIANNGECSEQHFLKSKLTKFVHERKNRFTEVEYQYHTDSVHTNDYV